MEPITPPVIIVHAVAASLVLLLGPVVFLRRSRDRVHKVLGRTWAVLIILTSLTSFAIMPRGFNVLHALAILTIVLVILAIVAVRRGYTRVHQFNMVTCYLATLISFAFAVGTPVRRIPRLLREEPVIFTLSTAALILAVALWTWAVIGMNRKAQALAVEPAVPATSEPAQIGA